MRIMATGGAGYIGTVLIRMLVGLGHSVVCIDPRGSDLAALLADVDGLVGAVEVSTGSVLDRDLVASLASRCDGAIHLAALVGAPACDADPNLARSLNLDGTARLLSALPPEMPVVFASTCSVYGRVQSDLCTEQRLARPLTLYAETKLQAERLVLDRGGVVLRFVTLYGLSPRFRWDLLLHTFLGVAARGEELHLFDPNACRPLLHVEDAARALLFGLENFHRLAGSVFNVGGPGAAPTKSEIARSIARLTPFKVSIDETRSDPDQRDYEVSSDKIASMGYRPAIDLASSLPEMLAFVQSQFVEDRAA